MRNIADQSRGETAAARIRKPVRHTQAAAHPNYTQSPRPPAPALSSGVFAFRFRNHREWSSILRGISRTLSRTPWLTKPGGTLTYGGLRSVPQLPRGSRWSHSGLPWLGAVTSLMSVCHSRHLRGLARRVGEPEGGPTLSVKENAQRPPPLSPRGKVGPSALETGLAR